MRSETKSKRCWHPLRHPALTTSAVGLTVCAAALLAGAPVAAQEFVLHAEPAVAFWLDEPQSERFSPGFYGAIRPGIALGRVVSLQWSYALLVTPARNGFTEDGTGHFLSTGVRVRPLAMLRPRSENLGGLFADANLGYVRTEDLDRFGYDVGLGYGFQIAPSFSIGPVLRYHQILQPNDTANEDPNDAQFVTLGLDLAFGSAPERAREMERECPVAPECARESPAPAPVADQRVMTVAEAKACPDRDLDGVCDVDDRCPAAVGPLATLGCPIDPCSGAPLVVLVQFDHDSAALPPPKDGAQTLDPVLDAVADAVMQDPSCRVCIVGHASIEGSDEYNLDLSRKRASAVQSYLTVRGLTETRMPTTGLGKRCQIVPESTLPLNRRVEFRRLQEAESCPTDCSP